MEKKIVEHSFGVCLKYGQKYLLYTHDTKKLPIKWAFPKGHYEPKDKSQVGPYGDLKVEPIVRKYNYPFEQCPSLICCAVRQLFEETGFILPSHFVRTRIGQKYIPQGELKCVSGNTVYFSQGKPFVFSNSKGVIEKYVGFFLGEVTNPEPNMKINMRKEGIKWQTIEQIEEKTQKGNFFQENYEVLKELNKKHEQIKSKQEKAKLE